MTATPATSFMSSASFTSLLTSDYHSTTNSAPASRGLGDRIAERTGSGVPKFKSLPPPSLPLTPPSAASPSSFGEAKKFQVNGVPQNLFGLSNERLLFEVWENMFVVLMSAPICLACL